MTAAATPTPPKNFKRLCTYCGAATFNAPEPINAPCSPSLRKCQQWRDNRPILRRVAAICTDCKGVHDAVKRVVGPK